VLRAGVGQFAEAVDDLGRGLGAAVPVLRDGEVLECRALDLLGVAADLGAMLGQDRVLAGDAFG